ncbi:hypothetical protein DRE_01475 [Drechslerella stenobrocha 248]|uniref:Protein prenylyltransferase n=1 Tax=Drechslerella stenobrocha 248 TaxID=1043628 RepID=W7HUS5_9PEZI|nr:hypothetical protein DRE_01475 [Drechslerella stenobrocha 248]
MADADAAAEAAAVYERITAFFQLHRHEEVQIELLPFYPIPDGHIYVDATAIGIPKSSLWKAFRHAHPLFFAALHAPSAEASRTSTIATASTILLLHDSEYLTAVNARKRILLSLFPPSSLAQAAPTSLPPITPLTELAFLTSLLTSPLHRHTKSPVLWSHRRWLLTTYPGLTTLPSRPSSARAAAAKAARKWARGEISTLFRAAEAHPRNYYAWTYARWLAGSRNVQFNQEDLVSWCIKHPSDVSGWGWLWTAERRSLAPAVYTDRRRDVLVQRYNQLLVVLKYSHEISPGHESLWRFIRAVLMQGVLDGDDDDAAGRGGGYKARIVDMLRGWDAREWPVRVAEDIWRERVCLRALVRDIDAMAAGYAVADTEMSDQPP